MSTLHPTVQITIESSDFSVFRGIFSYGFLKTVETGKSIMDVLCRQICISETYLNVRVQTVFLNGVAVDDICSEIVMERDVIALSAAMPGLAGAVFRKGGIFSSMRSACMPQTGNSSAINRPGYVTLKLFNLIAADLGAGFLKNGILLHGDDFIRFVNWKIANLRPLCRKVIIDGKTHDADDLLTVCGPDDNVLLYVNSE